MIKVLAGSGSGETFLLAHIQLLPGSEVSCIRTRILSMRTLPKHLPKVPPPHTITLGVSISVYIFRGTQTFRS